MAGANESGVVLAIPEVEPLVARWRQRHDPAADTGVPAHITLLYPFIPPDDLTPESLEALRTIAEGTIPFRFALVGVDEFPGLLWLRPEPAAAFVALIRRVWAAYPGFPPYGGRFPDPTPHLTVAVVEPEEQQVDLRRELEREIAGRLPVECDASALTILCSDATGRWSARHRFAFGGSSSLP
jgi:2'-5' RNA ligase